MSVRLPQRVGYAKAKELMFTGRALEAQEARALGLVHAIYPPELLREQARGEVGNATGCEAQHDAYRARWIVLSRSDDRQCGCKRDGERGNGGAGRMIHGESSVIRTMSGCLRGW
jgi:enoyl-CoA hydratase/carnithine racemase